VPAPSAEVSLVHGLLKKDQSTIPCCFVVLLLADLTLVVLLRTHHHSDGCMRDGETRFTLL
jgi:hypothetical protein